MKQLEDNFVVLSLSEILFERGLLNVATMQNIKSHCETVVQSHNSQKSTDAIQC